MVRIGQFKILERIGKVAYRLALLPQLTGMHNVFHVSMLRTYVYDVSHIIDFDIELKVNATYKERPVRILDRRVKQLRTKRSPWSKFNGITMMKMKLFGN